MSPALSIVIPSHNRPDLLQACLASVVRHAPADVEMIVVDDASPDQAAGRVADSFPGIRVIRLRHRRGFCSAANAGLRAAQGPVVELLNDDTEVAAGWAGPALAVFADPTVAAVAPLVLKWSKDRAAPWRIDSAGDRYYVGGIAGKHGHGKVTSGSDLHPGRVFGASASSAFYRRDLVLQVGGFPENFGAYFEDVDLAFRLNHAGYRIVFEPAARVFHRVSASHGRSGRLLLEQQSRNEERVFWRNIPDPLLGSALPRHAAVLAAKAWWRWERGGFWPFLTGRLRAWGEARELVNHRRRLRRLAPETDCSNWPLEMKFWGNAD